MFCHRQSSTTEHAAGAPSYLSLSHISSSFFAIHSLSRRYFSLLDSLFILAFISLQPPPFAADHCYTLFIHPVNSLEMIHVAANEVAFSIHACILTYIVLCQIASYELNSGMHDLHQVFSSVPSVLFLPSIGSLSIFAPSSSPSAAFSSHHRTTEASLTQEETITLYSPVVMRPVFGGRGFVPVAPLSSDNLSLLP
ncbi:Lysosomal cystine transporter [Senna tora]|uniref:Lysosomal cystine transporter n=1 Tax=Senna tora TaxID=362788 RepID=A0A834SBQ4_9FABA|nr:Lysosomal cystine transporter [Senna tora]